MPVTSPVPCSRALPVPNVLAHPPPPPRALSGQAASSKDVTYDVGGDLGEACHAGRVVWNLWLKRRKAIQQEFSTSGSVNVTAVGTSAPPLFRLLCPAFSCGLPHLRVDAGRLYTAVVDTPAHCARLLVVCVGKNKTS